MKVLGFRSSIPVEALPEASARLRGMLVDLQTDGNPYWCNGTEWINLASVSGGGPVTGTTGVFSGTLEHHGLTPTNGSGIDQTTIFTKSLTLVNGWVDTGIANTDLGTGSYNVQVFANDVSAGGVNSNEYYSGTLTWYANSVNSTLSDPSDEVLLHRAGAGEEGSLYLRTYRTADPDASQLKLQLGSDRANPGAANYVFTFRRIL